MRIKSLVLAILIVVSSLFVLTSCAEDDSEYPVALENVTEVEQLEYNKQAKEDFKIAYANTKALTNYTLDTKIVSKLSSLLSSKITIGGVFEKTNNEYSCDKVSISYSGFSLLACSCTSDSDEELTFVIDDENYFTLPFNYAAIGTLIYLDLPDEVIDKCTMVRLSPELVKFELSNEDVENIYSATFNFLSDVIEDSDVNFVNLFNMDFSDSCIYCTIEDGYVTSFETFFTGKSDGQTIEFEFKGYLSK